LRALKSAETAPVGSAPHTHLPLPPELAARFQAVGQHLPQLWQEGVIGPVHKKALLRTLIALVVVQRTARDQVQVRIVWKGGATTTLNVPTTVGAWTDLAGAAAMEATILEQSAHGIADEVIADQLTAQGYRSPQRPVVLPSTVKTIRLRHRLFRVRHQAHPRRVAGYLTISQLTERLGLTPHWIYDRIHNGTIQVAKDAQRQTFLFPDRPETLVQLQHLRDGVCRTVHFERE
jgi:hypothetical protein